MNPPAPISFWLPATSANLGPAFDAAALAVRVHLRIRAACCNSHFSIVARGRDSEICSRLEDNLLLDTYTDVLRQNGQPIRSIRLELDNEIPVGKGLGSSAAARLAGIALAVHFGSLGWTGDQILREAARREKHADNVAACGLGGLVIVHDHSRNADRSAPGVWTARIPVMYDWPLLLAVPTEPLSTEKSRDLVPGEFPKEHVIANLQSAMLLVAALSHGRSDLLRLALRDYIHEPYRAQVCPLLGILRKKLPLDGVIGFVLSGAGPSVLAILESERVVQTVAPVIRHVAETSGCPSELIATHIESEGFIGQLPGSGGQL